MNGRNKLEYCRMLSSDANNLDHWLGEPCFGQVRKQLKGVYLPEERLYCIEAVGGDENRVEFLVRDIVSGGAWPSDDYSGLWDIGPVHGAADPYRRTDSREFIVGELERTLRNRRAGKLLETYRGFHRSYEKDTDDRVLTAIRTGQGVLLFDDTGRGLERAESYLQYNADNFFSPIYRSTDKLGVYYLSTDNARLVEKVRECDGTFIPDDRCRFIPSVMELLRVDILRGCKPVVKCDMSPDLARYREMLKTFKLTESETPFNIGILGRLCRTGNLDEMPESRKFGHFYSLSPLCSWMNHPFFSLQADTLLGNSMRQAVSDTARRILQNEYDVRGYELPTPDMRRRWEKKPEKTGKKLTQKDNIMALWLEKLGPQRTHPHKERLKDFCLELCPDNRMASFMITDHTPRSGNPFTRFVKEAARKATLDEAWGVPDNLLLFYADIRKEGLSPASGLQEKEPRLAWRSIIENGGTMDGNSVPLRRAAYLKAYGVETDRKSLEGLEHSAGYKDFVAYETARERTLQGKSARFLMTAVKMDQGVRVFNRGLHGPCHLRGYLQEIADNSYSPYGEGSETLPIFRIKISSKRLIGTSR